jgi:hypothetical protein
MALQSHATTLRGFKTLDKGDIEGDLTSVSLNGTTVGVKALAMDCDKTHVKNPDTFQAASCHCIG